MLHCDSCLVILVIFENVFWFVNDKKFLHLTSRGLKISIYFYL